MQVDIGLCKNLLSYFNWRPRIAGAYLCALRDFSDLEEQIGNLLLRSDLCYTGFGYCIALCAFNTKKGVDYLNRYLEYFLTRPELFFDQNSALAALFYLDEINQTNHAELHMTAWDEFIKNKQNWDINRERKSFKEYMALVLALKQKFCANLYMAAEVKRKYYPLRFGFQLFSCFRSSRTHALT